MYINRGTSEYCLAIAKSGIYKKRMMPREKGLKIIHTVNSFIAMSFLKDARHIQIENVKIHPFVIISCLNAVKLKGISLILL